MRQFSYALRTAVHDFIGQTLAELFLGRKLITKFKCFFTEDQMSESMEVNMLQLLQEAQEFLRKAQYNILYTITYTVVLWIHVVQNVILETHILNPSAQTIVADFVPKYEGLFLIVQTSVSNVVIKKKDHGVPPNIDQFDLITIELTIQNFIDSHPIIPPGGQHASLSSEGGFDSFNKGRSYLVIGDSEVRRSQEWRSL